MANDLNGVYASGVEAVAGELRQEFIDEARERVGALDVALDAVRNGRKDPAELTAVFRKTALAFRSQAANVGLRLIGTLAYRLEDYLANARELPPRALDDLQVFIDRLDDVLEGRLAPDSDASQVVRDLPSKIGISAAEIEVRNIEVMLVMLHGTATHFVERELQQCGYRVNTVTTVFEAFPLIVRTKPDLVVVSAIMPELDGIDLAIGLAAMPATRNIPLAVITSLDPGDEHLAMVPKHIPVIQKGPSFGDDLFKALDSLFLI
ncbi:MAG: Hpt domain-containing protein [Magnetospirillum sp. WYHS-4]